MNTDRRTYPIDGLVFSNAIVNELGVFWGNSRLAKRLACVVLQHFDL